MPLKAVFAGQVNQHEATPQQTERLRLKALSTQRTARWPNTLQVQFVY